MCAVPAVMAAYIGGQRGLTGIIWKPPGWVRNDLLPGLVGVEVSAHERSGLECS